MSPDKVCVRLKIVPSPARSRVRLVGRQPVTCLMTSMAIHNKQSLLLRLRRYHGANLRWTVRLALCCEEGSYLDGAWPAGKYRCGVMAGHGLWGRGPWSHPAAPGWCRDSSLLQTAVRPEQLKITQSLSRGGVPKWVDQACRGVGGGNRESPRHCPSGPRRVARTVDGVSI